ncbi:MAG TPA: hypothetical protein VJR48_15310 [Ktedonobacterales bacterium]|nr:hypothetical protein [Ktedonobacterales bacterium]
MDSSGQYDPNDPNYPAAADEGDVRDTAQDAMDRRMGDTNGDIDGDTSYEGLVGEPSGAHSGRTGVVGEPSGTGAGASGIAGSSRTDANYDPTQQSMAGSVAGGPDATAAGQNLQQGMNQGVGDQDMSPDMGSQGINPQGYDTTNQGLGAQAADPDLSGQDYDSQNQTDQGYDDTSSATQP